MSRGRHRRVNALPRVAPRVLLAFLPLVIAFLFVLGRTASIQFGQQPQLEKRVNRLQPVALTSYQSIRGNIFDRAGRPLAINVQVKSVYMDAVLFKRDSNYKAKLPIISRLTGVSLTKIKEELKSESRFFWLKRQISPQLEEALKTIDSSGLFFVEDSRRYYPNGNLAAHLIGFTNREGNGVAGIEYALNRRLKGEEGVVRGMRDAKGRPIITGGIVREATAGEDIHLTLDSVLQYVAEQELDQVISKTRARGAMSIIMDPNTGELLSLAIRPTFDPNRYQETNNRVWKNRAITDVFEPGSTFKPFVIAHAIDQRLIQPGQAFYCKPGSLVYRRKAIHEKPHGDWLNPTQIIKFSSNIGAARISLLTGDNRMEEMIRGFGFTRSTEVGLAGESGGLLRPAKMWNEFDLAAMGFGQGIGVTGMQLIRGFSALINGGILLKPYLVEHGETNGVRTFENRPQVLGQPIQKRTSEIVRRMMTHVVEEGGTGILAKLANYQVGGKTGTAQRFDVSSSTYAENSYTSSFVGFIPADVPRLAILVVVDEPQGAITTGGFVAAPLFQRIAQRAAEALQILPDDQRGRGTLTQNAALVYSAPGGPQG